MRFSHPSPWSLGSLPMDRVVSDGSVALLGEQRGSVMETLHRGHVAVVDCDARLVVSAGEPESAIAFLRSTAKPFQAVAIVMEGIADTIGLSQSQLAVMCGSHSGEDIHLDTVRAILAKIDQEEGDLLCGLPPEPDRRRTPAAHQCSGKHAGMLAFATCRDRNSSKDYARPSHPVQQAIRAVIAAFLGANPSTLMTATESCGVPTFGASVSAVATAYARLADPKSLPARLGQASGRVLDAMVMHPELVEGDQRFDTELLRATRGRIVTKSGSAGIQAACDRDAGIGLAVKVEDGDISVARIILVEVLARLELLHAPTHGLLAEYHRPVYHSALGERVSSIVSLFDLA